MHEPLMWGFVTQVSDLIAQNPEWAIMIAFSAAIIEAVAVLGILIPGTPILMAVAGAAAMADMPMTPILVVSIVGCIIGDGISFWLGHRYSGRLRAAWPFATRPWMMQRAEAFFGRYGTMSVALCRFIPVLRSTVPLVAGMAGMRRQRFLIANVASAFVWAPAHVLPAQFAGRSILDIQEGHWESAAMWGGGVLAFILLGVALHHVVKATRRPQSPT